MTDKQKQIAAIEELREDHRAFYSVEGVQKFTEPFGFVGTTQIEQSEPWEPGGLRFHDKWRTQARGQDARQIVYEIAEHLGLDDSPVYPGFNFRKEHEHLCDVILHHLDGRKID
jgi:hypothetical protein